MIILSILCKIMIGRVSACPTVYARAAPTHAPCVTRMRMSYGLMSTYGVCVCTRVDATYVVEKDPRGPGTAYVRHNIYAYSGVNL
jgi:hypothetical protein